MFQGVITGRVKFKEHEPISEDDLKNLPKPNGIWIRVWPLKAQEVTKGGLLMDTQSRTDEEQGACIGYVEAVGSLTYDHDKYQNNVYCKPGDYILYARHQGLDFEIKGRHFKLIQDDRPLMTFSLEQLKNLGVLD